MWVSWLHPDAPPFKVTWKAWLSFGFGLLAVTHHFVLLLAERSEWAVPSTAAPGALEAASVPAASELMPIKPVDPKSSAPTPAENPSSSSPQEACGPASATLDAPYEQSAILPAAATGTPGVHLAWELESEAVGLGLDATAHGSLSTNVEPETSWLPGGWLAAHYGLLTLFALLNTLVVIITYWELTQTIAWAFPHFHIPVAILWILVAMLKAGFAAWGRWGEAVDVFVHVRNPYPCCMRPSHCRFHLPTFSK